MCFTRKHKWYKKRMFSYSQNMTMKHALLEVFRTNFPKIEPREVPYLYHSNFFARLTAGFPYRPLLRSALLRSALIAHTTDRKSVVLAAGAVPVHNGAIVVETAVECGVVIELRSTPKEGVVAEIAVVAAAVVASGKGRETSGVVGTGVIAHGTSACTAIPSCSGG